MVCGGAKVYKDCLPLANKLYLSKIDYKFLFESYWGTNISPEIDLQRNDRDMHELEEYYSSISTEEFVLLILTSELTRVFEKYHKIEKK